MYIRDINIWFFFLISNYFFISIKFIYNRLIYLYFSHWLLFEFLIRQFFLHFFLLLGSCGNNKIIDRYVRGASHDESPKWIGEKVFFSNYSISTKRLFLYIYIFLKVIPIYSFCKKKKKRVNFNSIKRNF